MRATSLSILLVTLLLSGCGEERTDLLPDARLQSELGLTSQDRVHTVGISTGSSERAEPDSVAVLPGDYVQFVSEDWLVHEMAFELDSLSADLRGFLERTGQTASPPLLERDGRFVLSFAEAPPGRYPYALAGNRRDGRGVIVVLPRSPR